ncbi:MAG: DUF2924 domain-containing protein [Planctomycetes bacterium]|nr:DUF2924 domain-containing protein [Planctomycetota bacterium]
MEHQQSVLIQLAALEKMTFQQMKAYWIKEFNREPPKYKAKFLRKRLAYYIQEQAYGGISDHARQRMQDIYEKSVQQKNEAAPKKEKRLMRGSVISRQYKGVLYEVKILESGYEFLGKPWRSLSAIARDITGTNWNGPAFFGLRKKGT